MEFRLEIWQPPKPLDMGRPCLFDTPLFPWQNKRRYMERVLNRPDPLLMKLGRSTFQQPQTCPTNNANSGQSDNSNG